MTEHRYYIDGKRVPGVTTILGELGWKTGGLLHWAYDEGRENADKEGWTLADSRREAISDGTKVHRWAEVYLLSGEDARDPFDALSPASRAFDGFLKWMGGKSLAEMLIEQPITCREFKCGGRPDLIAKESDRLCIYDWKTYDGKDGKKEPYAEYWVQLAAYAKIYEREFVDMIDDLVIVMLNKTTGDADEYRLPVLSDKADAALRAFKLARELYDLRKTLTKKEEGWE